MLFLEYLNQVYASDEGVFWRLRRAIKDPQERHDPYLLNFELWMSNLELRAVQEHGGKFGTSKFHDFQFHRRINTMCRALHGHCIELIVMLRFERIGTDEASQRIIDNIKRVVAVVADEAPEQLLRFQYLFNVAAGKLKRATPVGVGVDDYDIEPERLCLLWLWVLVRLHDTINRVVSAKFGAKLLAGSL